MLSNESNGFIHGGEEMTKKFYAGMVLNFVVLMFVFILPPLSHAGQRDVPGNAETTSIANTAADATAPTQQDTTRFMVADEEHYCVRHCRRHYEERLRECWEPDHPHHYRCEAWAREREQECLEECYRQRPRW